MPKIKCKSDIIETLEKTWDIDCSDFIEDLSTAISELLEQIPLEEKEIYNEKEIGKTGTHAIATNQNYGYNQAIQEMKIKIQKILE